SWAFPAVGESGTLVVWTRCDRLDNRHIPTLIRKLHRELGRRFRYPLFNGVGIMINGVSVDPIDPLYAHPRALLSGAKEYQKPLDYSLRSLREPETIASVSVRFTQLPIQRWHNWSGEQKRRHGISGGAGVSVVRAGREIAYGWYFLRG